MQIQVLESTAHVRPCLLQSVILIAFLEIVVDFSTTTSKGSGDCVQGTVLSRTRPGHSDFPGVLPQKEAEA